MPVTLILPSCEILVASSAAAAAICGSLVSETSPITKGFSFDPSGFGVGVRVGGKVAVTVSVGVVRGEGGRFPPHALTSTNAKTVSIVRNKRE